MTLLRKFSRRLLRGKEVDKDKFLYRNLLHAAEMPPLQMPPLIFDEKKLGLATHPASPKLQPRYETSLEKRAPDEGEQQPPTVGAAELDQGTVDLEYLDDLEPLPMGRNRNSRNNSLNLVAGLHDSFPAIFNPPDMHQSLPSDLNSSGSGSDSNRRGSDKRNPSDPFYEPFQL